MSKPFFVKLHLQRSSQNPHFIVGATPNLEDTSVIHISFGRLTESSRSLKSITLTNDPYYRLKDKDCFYVVGSCHGLVCLLGYSLESAKTWFRFWNLATRTISDKLGHFCGIDNSFNFAFGYDYSKDTYKVTGTYACCPICAHTKFLGTFFLVV